MAVGGSAGVPPSAVPVRDAATVALLRDGADGLEVWLQQRAPTLVFAAGMYAFPGGAVDAADSDVPVPPGLASDHAARWGCDAGLAARLVAAGVRETREEAGVLLPAEALVPWARWITPPGLPRRFDARFYLAPLPPDQQPRPLTGEVAGGGWSVVREAVDEYAVGTLPMFPPTIAVLTSLTAFDTVAEAVASPPRSVPAVTG